MTQRDSQKRARRPAGRRWRSRAAMSVLAVPMLVAGGPAAAQTATQDLQDPPPSAPASRLLVTPHEFERWMSATPQDARLAATPPEQPPERLTAPPPPPRLASPPPPPKLASPPPPSLAPPPAAPAAAPVPSTAPGVPAAAPPAARAATPPAPPDLSNPPGSPQLATLPPDSDDTSGATDAVVEPLARPGDIRISYAAEATELPDTARAALDGLAAWLRENPSTRIEVVGYAETPSPTESEARRLSLLRARDVRSYLVDRGVLSTRIDVRALGSRTEETPRNRVDVKVPPQ